jgi:hypothetical protein
MVGLILRGRIRSVKDGVATIGEGHPSFDHLTDEAIAAVINHLAEAGGVTVPEGGPIAPREVRASRAAGR